MSLGRNAVSDEPVDALYRACKRYEEIHSRGGPPSALDHAWSTICMYYCQRVRDGDYLPPPPREVTTDGYYGMASDSQVLAWIGRLMTEIEMRRNMRGRGTGQGATIV